MDKRKEKFLRIKYLREIERFINRVVNYLNTQKKLEKEAFFDFVEEKFQKVKECEKVYLSKGYAEAMEEFAFKIPSMINGKDDISDIKEEILYQANRVRKTKRLKRYRKEKYKNFDEEF